MREDTLTKHLLSLSQSGVYITNLDLVKIAKKLDISLPYKTKSILAQKLFTQIKSKNTFSQFISYMYELLNERKNEYIKLASLYSSLKPIFAENIHKIENTKKILALHVRDKYDN